MGPAFRLQLCLSLNHFGDSRFRTRVKTGFRIHFRTRVCIPCIIFRHDTNLRIESLLPLQFFSGIGGHTPNDRSHRAFRSVVCVVDRLVLPDMAMQLVVLYLIGVL